MLLLNISILLNFLKECWALLWQTIKLLLDQCEILKLTGMHFYAEIRIIFYLEAQYYTIRSRTNATLDPWLASHCCLCCMLQFSDAFPFLQVVIWTFPPPLWVLAIVLSFCTLSIWWFVYLFVCLSDLMDFLPYTLIA